MTATSWLLLLFSLPTNRNTERVAVWRRLKKMGAVQIKTSTYLLPDEPVQYEQFQWLAKQIRDSDGDSTLVRAQEIEGLTREKVIAMFNDARTKDYAALRKSLQSFIARRKKLDAEEAAAELERLTRQFREIRDVDFFDSARGHDFDMLDAEFSHHGNNCTFETLTKCFAISDRSVAKIGEMIHDAGLDDARFQRVEAVGIDRVLKGWGKQGLPDEEILRRGFECFDALYAFLQRR